MSLVEQARARLDEARTKIKTRIEAIRGGSPLGGSVLSGKLLGQGAGPLELPALKDVREKGVLGVLSEKFPKIKEIRERRILAGPSGGYKLTTETPEEKPKKEPVTGYVLSR